ncbi:hypothetical protein [Cecembia calidifontis]|uniref:WD40 repeat protein n=1 Tax=Cecembia calidifontis TaxID=1187080 RepID=A0A4Q7PAX1_9BACT|nr:hypothetical protein [Cecembia calidifontis]RZS97117.1 hypothetical protein BC751_2714 [Cecembia calidifontis]
MFKRFLFLKITLTSIAFTSFSQVPTDLIAVDVKVTGANLKIFPETTVKITDRKAYDNQPNFINEKQMAFSAADDKGNHDIIIYNFESKKFTNLTKTNDKSEYSPSLTDCGLYVSAVTVEEDGKQRLWLYPTNFGEPELLYDDIEPVGYYDWYDNKAAMFVLGTPNSLVYPYSKGEIFTISQNVGRSIKRKPKSSIITYIDKNIVKEINGLKSYAIKGFDIEKRTYQDFGFTYPGSEDFIWLNHHLILMGSGNQLFVRKANSKEWELAGSIHINGYKNISRIAYSPKLKKLVVVMNRTGH